MQVDTMKIWTRAEIRASVAKILVESLGLEEAAVTDEASLVRDLRADSIDFLDISFKCQQTFGVDLPSHLIQDKIVEWRALGVLARVIADRYDLAVSPEELRTIAPSTVAAILQHLEAKHGVARSDGAVEALALALAERLLRELDGTGLDLAGLEPGPLARYFLENLHSPNAIAEVLNRFTVRALDDYLAAQLAAASRLATGA